MTASADRLSPRQRDCLRLVWEKQATSKEIAVELGISKHTIDAHIAEAIETLGARDRRDAAAIAFGDTPRKLPPTASGDDSIRVGDAPSAPPDQPRPTDALSSPRPWRTRAHPRNSLALGETLMWIAVIAVGSLVALSLAVSIGNGISPVAIPIIEGVRRLTH